MPYRVTIAIDARQPLVLLRAYQTAMLECLTRINTVYAQNHATPAPEPLLVSGQVQIVPDASNADYRDIPTVLRYEGGTLSDFSAWRAAMRRRNAHDFARPSLVGPPPGDRTTFVLDAFNGTLDPGESEVDLSALLDLLVRINELYLYVYPDTPLFRSTRIRYVEEPPGLEDWQDIARCLQMGIADCEDLCCWRIAELRVRFGVPARPIIIPQLERNGRYLYHIQVWTPWGVEDPSLERGMAAA